MSLPGLKRAREAIDDDEPAAKKAKPTPPAAAAVIPSTANLLQLYNLTALQASVARSDPVTGEKINKLRKHYSGKVKQLGLEGKAKPLEKQNELGNEGFFHPDWDNVDADGRTMWQAQRGDALLDEGVETVLSKVEAALAGLRAGQMPSKEHEQWKAHLGLDEVVATTATPAVTTGMVGKAQSPAAAFLAKTAPAATVRNSAPASPNRARPERTGRKRRYDDASFEGYD